MSVNIPPKVGSLITKIGENMEEGDEIMYEVNGVKYQIIQKTAAVEKTDSAPQGAVCMGLYTDGFDDFDCKNPFPKKVGSLIVEKNDDITSEMKGVKYQIIGNTATVEKIDPAYLAYLVSKLWKLQLACHQPKGQLRA